MPRYKLTIEYDGTPYAGWQRQENGHTVQAAIEQAIFKFCGETISLAQQGAPIPVCTQPHRWLTWI